MLEGMGFPVVRCQRALLATGNSDGEAAMEWLFAHMDDPSQCQTSSHSVLGAVLTQLALRTLARTDIDDPIPAPSASSSAPSATAGPSPDQISMLADMGFSVPHEPTSPLRPTR